ncbi:hypothetical protein N7539_008155 [Penicillium diatomitis]|uniref:Protein phosphatase n=1 Tax=Penicillium diatomitis TaxID=2819901 RepID=A0A9W9WTB0_9EURO|nr:uncharacterized protein N7539_008155 [Penicillium diatomitis]KAJ5475089.1 hypothetical protein N7539_008155 [Penicillium diatomitis]
MISPSVPSRVCSSTCNLQQLSGLFRQGVCFSSRDTLSFSVLGHSLPCSASKPRKSALHTTSSRSFHSSPGRFSNPSSSSARISYKVAVSSTGKGRRFHPLKNVYHFDPAKSDMIGVSKDPSPSVRKRNRPDSGEDAFFVSRIGSKVSGHPDTDGAVAFAVADGVGGWTESRVDPADFSHGLCGYMAQSALTWDSPADRLRPKQLLQAGYDQVVKDPTIKAGGSTASVGVGLTDGRVELANLGDSGSVLLRLAAVHHYSVPQTHGFNTPYQLSVIPPKMRAQASVFGGSFLEDTPQDAAVTNVQMQHGDVLILATDGVFDNLNNQDILKIVTTRMVMTGAWTATEDSGVKISREIASLTVPGGLASAFPPPKSADKEHETLESVYTLQSLLAASIAGEAKAASMDFRRDGPFAKEAQRYYPGDYYRGGKVDDICALVMIAVDENQVAHK